MKKLMYVLFIFLMGLTGLNSGAAEEKKEGRWARFKKAVKKLVEVEGPGKSLLQLAVIKENKGWWKSFMKEFRDSPRSRATFYSLSYTDKDGYNALMDALEYGRVGMAADLMYAIEKFDLGLRKAILNQENLRGETPLLLAARYGGSKVNWLLRAGANPHAVDKEGNTALILLANKGEPEALALLLAEGVDPFIRNKKGETALDIATLWRLDQNKDVLEKAMKKVVKPALLESTPLPEDVAGLITDFTY